MEISHEELCGQRMQKAELAVQKMILHPETIDQVVPEPVCVGNSADVPTNCGKSL
jgi:hypothetical protein